jgi:ribosomal protein L14E/L6E/L27E
MDLTNELTIGQVVKSRAGRDNGRVFLILDIIDEIHVLIVDGDLRKLNNPKKKKVKHLIIYNTVLPGFKQKLEDSLTINDAYIRKSLEPFKESI